MTGFCVETIVPEPGLRPDHGILRAAALTVTTDARVAAQRMLDSAQAQADQLLQQARTEALQMAQQTQQEALARAAQLLQTLEQANAALVQRAQPLVVELAQRVFERLALAMPPRERIEAMLKRVQREAPARLANALLRVHPEDLPLLPEVEWQVKADAALPRGMCRLEAAAGEWCAHFDAAVAALQAACTQVLQEVGEPPQTEPRMPVTERDAADDEARLLDEESDDSEPDREQGEMTP